MCQKGNIRKKVAVILAAIVIIPTVLLSSIRWLLPDRLTLIEGENTKIDTQLPISAKLDHSVGVLGVTTQPLADAHHLELGSAIMAEPLAAGETTITFYLCNAFPIKTVEATVLPKTELIPVGQTVGVTLDTKGLLVLGTGQVDLGGENQAEPSKSVIKAGDLILEANGVELINKETFHEVIQNCDGKEIVLIVERKGEKNEIAITPVFSQMAQEYKLGIWVRDSIQGIGTVTFYDPKTQQFGALGHGVYDVDTGELMVIKEGSLIPSELTEIVKGEKGEPGELTGTVERGRILGEIKRNTEVGIYGRMAGDEIALGEAIPIALRQEIKEGPAVILSNIRDGVVQEYSIVIESVGRSAGKDMMLRITDKWLLENTGGIVQGMSGSPIIQDGKLVGAVTHVLVNDPQRGYGTLIETMLKETDIAR